MCGKGLRSRKSSARVVHMEATTNTPTTFLTDRAVFDVADYRSADEVAKTTVTIDPEALAEAVVFAGLPADTTPAIKVRLKSTRPARGLANTTGSAGGSFRVALTVPTTLSNPTTLADVLNVAFVGELSLIAATLGAEVDTMAFFDVPVFKVTEA